MKETIRILIVEDELLIAEMLREMLVELGYRVNGIAKNYSEAISFLEKKGETDLCFLDINLEDQKSGFDLAREIRQTFRVPFVFLTSYSDKKTIEEAAAFQPETYLVKPFSQTDLFSTVEIIRARTKTNAKEEIPAGIIIRDGNLNVKIHAADILWLKSDNIYVEVKTAAKTFLVRNSLERFMEELNDRSLVRTHRSFAVNIKHVKAVTGQFLILGTEKIPLSRKFREQIHQQFRS